MAPEVKSPSAGRSCAPGMGDNLGGESPLLKTLIITCLFIIVARIFFSAFSPAVLAKVLRDLEGRDESGDGFCRDTGPLQKVHLDKQGSQ